MNIDTWASFPAAPEQVAVVRRFVEAALPRHCPVRDDAVLIAGEIAANAVMHGSRRDRTDARIEAGIEHRDGACWGEVWDGGGPGVPHVRPIRADPPDLAALTESGRGLALVEALADRWGWYGGRGGRVVWFEIDDPGCTPAAGVRAARGLARRALIAGCG